MYLILSLKFHHNREGKTLIDGLCISNVYNTECIDTADFQNTRTHARTHTRSVNLFFIRLFTAN